MLITSQETSHKLHMSTSSALHDRSSKGNDSACRHGVLSFGYVSELWLVVSLLQFRDWSFSFYEGKKTDVFLSQAIENITIGVKITLQIEAFRRPSRPRKM